MEHGVEVRREAGKALRVLAQAAARLAEQRARRREQRMRAIEQASRERAQQLREQFIAQRSAAEARLKPVFEPTWLDNAEQRRVTDTYLLAREWAEYSPLAAAAAADIRHQVWERTGVDIEEQSRQPATETETDRQAPAQAQDKRDNAQSDAGKAAHKADQDLADRAAAAFIVAEAYRAETEHDREQYTAAVLAHEQAHQVYGPDSVEAGDAAVHLDRAYGQYVWADPEFYNGMTDPQQRLAAEQAALGQLHQGTSLEERSTYFDRAARLSEGRNGLDSQAAHLDHIQAGIARFDAVRESGNPAAVSAWAKTSLGDDPQQWNTLAEQARTFHAESTSQNVGEDSSAAEHDTDTPLHSDTLRSHLEATGADEEAVEARMFVDRQNAHPIVEALKNHTATPLTGEDDNGNVIEFRQRPTDMER